VLALGEMKPSVALGQVAGFRPIAGGVHGIGATRAPRSGFVAAPKKRVKRGLQW
jgi:hypothetical protein